MHVQMERPSGLYRVKSDGSDRVKLWEGNARTPRLTPDGRTVLFARDSGLYSVPVGGGPARQLSERTVGRDISVSLDGSRVLFNTTDTPGVVVLCDLPDCTNPKDLPLRSAFWAPDGAGVAYVENGTTIMEQPLDGGPPRRLAHLEGDEPIINFRWSPDGSRLATSRGRYPNDLYSSRASAEARPREHWPSPARGGRRVTASSPESRPALPLVSATPSSRSPSRMRQESGPQPTPVLLEFLVRLPG